jgi:hypothetical protein
MWDRLLAHHRSVRTARVSLLIPAIIVGFAPVAAGLAMFVGFGKDVPARDPITGRLSSAWDPTVFNEKGKLLLVVAAVMLVCAGAVLLLRILERSRIQRSTPRLVEWICGAPSYVQKVVLEGRAVSEISGNYAYGFSVPTIVAQSMNGEESELEISWEQVPFAQHLLSMALPPGRFSVNLVR